MSDLHDFCWRLFVGLEASTGNPAHLISPAADPFPRISPRLKIRQIKQGSLIVDLVNDLDTGWRLGVSTGAASGALWLLYRVLKRGPRTIAEFIGEVLSMKSAAKTRASRARKELAEAAAEEADAETKAIEARIRLWLAQGNEDILWTRYQQLLNVAPGFEPRMVDQNGSEIEPPEDASSTASIV